MSDTHPGLSMENSSALYYFSTLEETSTMASNYTPRPSSPTLRYDHLKYIMFVCGLLTFFFGLIGNSLVLYILTRFSEVRVKSVANYYIYNLALADIIFVFVLPFSLHATFSGGWVFGSPLCKILSILREINKFGSIFTLVALSMDRYIASFHTLGHLRTICVGKCVCVSAWIISIAMCTPYILYASTRPTRAGSYSCGLNFPPAMYHRRIWTYSQIALAMIVPFLLITISYVLLLRRLRIIMSARGADRVRKPNRKMTRTVLVVVVIFIICQTPYYVTELVNLQIRERALEAIARGERYALPPTAHVIYLYFTATATILSYISSCCNPVLYGIMNENYRKLYKMALCCFNLRRRGSTVGSFATNGRSSYVRRDEDKEDRVGLKDGDEDVTGSADEAIHLTSQNVDSIPMSQKNSADSHRENDIS